MQRIRYVLCSKAMALALVSAVGAGCSADDSPRLVDAAEDVVASSPSTAAGDSPGLTPRDKASSRPHESPKAFVRRWIRVSNKMQNTGEIGPYLSISRGCSDCRAIAKRVKSMFDSGGFARTGGLTVLHMSSSEAWGNGPVIDVRVDSAPTAFKERKSAPVQRLPGGTVVYRFRLSQSRPWQMTMLTQVPS